MAKKSQAKRNPPDPKREPVTMKISASEHFPGRITNLFKVWKCNGSDQNEVNKATIKIIQGRCIWTFCKDGYVCVQWHDHDNALLRQVAHDGTDDNQLWFEFGGQLA